MRQLGEVADELAGALQQHVRRHVLVTEHELERGLRDERLDRVDDRVVGNGPTRLVCRLARKSGRALDGPGAAGELRLQLRDDLARAISGSSGNCSSGDVSVQIPDYAAVGADRDAVMTGGLRQRPHPASRPGGADHDQGAGRLDRRERAARALIERSVGAQQGSIEIGQATTLEACPRCSSDRPHGTVTPCSTTGPRVGSSSVACDTPDGGIVSITFGTVLGSTEQIGLVPPGAQTPNENGCGVARESARLVGAEAVLAGERDREHPARADGAELRASAGSASPSCSASSTTNCGEPERRAFEAHPDGAGAKPWTSIRSLQASAGAIV